MKTNKKKFHELCGKYKFVASYSGSDKTFYVRQYHGTATTEAIEKFKADVDSTDDIKDCKFKFE